ncbi:DUF882 domain-containing protein [Mesorhizobium sp. M8A.F.Ca.ET.161.01.1.1]|uniref:DUF882 domain-containing protein n=3 Tax=Mesorhizobium TaxID=68287 RepID=UPI000FCB3649|nr:DUF882 domain-containing protein [Mesorhizobium sp. M8A.F.Ca.ET.021.01.1.1]RWC68812.1 MAG: DUF882 domain-containing protein [Mesorhizobium sp.]TGP91259.1 DUF882 domain-containing protein [Mesorhizobium sp. M8A.F.Ca.ET.218.01.1.1]TGR30418.1 DUF882 domain-containing protein [Mesorhizobium sp. M8A.F.Ca.ET.202.01.1.1]TGR31146.1 DUF882 domain-containing protein [Mesorhizobium sp. M8A.F.Ca.ET.197.01.1.1]TGR48730.1 DUF882 domain-containing protein [bacterium M00.F.Ca.ET.199.01.1.1]TGR56989.1 DUF8
MSVWPRWLAAVIVAFGFVAAAATGAQAEVRSLKLYHLHTHEKAEIVYKRNGRYVPEGLRKINIILRDWRRNEPTKMDPRLLDLVWEAYRESGATDYIQVVCGYRSPSTNSMLRSRSRGVAEKSQHMLGKAMDFYIPGVPLKKLRNIGLKMQGGGVGYYPTSGSPFVHMDVGNVRHWPGISRQELVSLFPNGKTLHVPSDGRPLPGYEQALASYKSRKGSGTPNIEMASAGGSGKKSGGFLAAFFGGGGADEADDSADVETASAAPAPKAGNLKPAATAKSSDLPGIAIVAPENAQRAEIPQVADEQAPEPEKNTPETIIAALPAKEIPLPDFAPRPKADVGAQPPENVPFAMADATATTEQAVATAQAPANMPFGKSDPAAIAEAAAADPAQVALNNIPLPTWRPERSLPADLAPPPSKDVLMALAETADQGKTATDAFSVVPTARPEPTKPDAVKAVLDEANAQVGTADEYQVASLSEEPRSAFNDPSGVDAASPRQAVAARPAGSDPAAAIGAGVKTTRKEARATARDQKPGPRAVVVAAAPQAARWALTSGENVATVSSATTAPGYAYSIVHTPPSEVYTAGFQPSNQMADASRFTGNAVKFMSVARFQTK